MMIIKALYKWQIVITSYLSDIFKRYGKMVSKPVVVACL